MEEEEGIRAALKLLQDSTEVLPEGFWAILAFSFLTAPILVLICFALLMLLLVAGAATGDQCQ